MDNTILSIVVPVYNVEKYINECIDKFIKEYKDGIEIILVDDGTKDSCGKICEEYAKKYSYITVVHKENGGLSSARNVGIKIAKGKYIWCFDSDDYISPNSLELILKELEKDCDLVALNYKTFTVDDSVQEFVDFKKIDLEKEKFHICLLEKSEISFMACRFIVKKNIVVNNNIFFTEGIYHEDEDWTPRMALKVNKFEIIEYPIYNYRVGLDSSIMGMLNEKKVKDKLFITKKFYELSNSKELTKSEKEFIESRIEHVFIAAINEISLYNSKVRNNLKENINKLICVLDNIDTSKSMLVKKSIKLVGVINTSKLLRLRLKIRGN